MFAFFGLGAQELILLGVLAAVPIVVVAVILYVNRASGGASGPPAVDEDRGPDRPA